MQNEAVIVDAVRTPMGKRDGMLKTWHPVDLLAHALAGLVQRNKLNPESIDDVIAGCVMQAGEQSLNVGRNAVLASGLPESIPGTTVDRQCGSSQQAIQFAAATVKSGLMDVVIAAGVESMTRVPMGLPWTLPQQHGYGHYRSPAVDRRYPNKTFSQFNGAEMMAEKYRLERDALDRYALESHQRAAAAIKAGRFDQEIVPLEILGAEGPTGEMHTTD